MPNQPTQTGNPASHPPDPRAAALECLRLGKNPFAGQVAAVGTAEESIRAGVPEFTAPQFLELLDVIATYRADHPATRVFAILGERGAGKTHLLYALRAELRQRAIQSGEETMLVVVDRLSAGMDPIDYLLWQIVNHLLASKGEGERLLGVIAGRLTGRLLAESLRRLAPHQRASLIAPAGLWDRLGLRAGRPAVVQASLDGIDRVVSVCDGRSPIPDELRRICEEVRLPHASAVGVIEKHLEQTESNDALGWLRRQLYGGLARLALIGGREPFENLHAGEYEDAPANVRNAGNLSRRLLDAWVELLSALRIPVVVIFDQLEDYLRSADPQQEKANSQCFTGATALFINELRHVCILIFAEQGYWTDLLNRAEPFAAERLSQPFALPGRPAKPYILMPERVPPEILTRVVRQRIRTGFPDLDLTGLPAAFPFDHGDLQALGEETTIRRCLRRLATRYDEIVHCKAPQKEDLCKRLEALWRDRLAEAEGVYGTEMNFRVAFIPEVQNALHRWLECLWQHGLHGSGPWKKVEMLADPKKQPYDNLCVIRTEGEDAPGVGVAAWLGKKRAQSFDLKQRLSYFEANPRPIRTLVMLRADGEEALVGETRVLFEKARKSQRDVRVHQYEPRHLHSLMAFTPWWQAAAPEVEAARDADPNASDTFRDFLGKLSGELLEWVNAWRQPPSADKESLA